MVQAQSITLVSILFLLYCIYLFERDRAHKHGGGGEGQREMQNMQTPH